MDHLTLGASLNYLFGKIESKEEMSSANIADNILVYQNAYYNKFYMDFGIQYYFTYKKDYVITLGGVFGSNHRINIKNDITVSESTGVVFMEEVTNKGTFNMPLHGGLGVAVNYKNKLTVTADYLYHNWSSTKSEEKDFQFKSNHMIRGGLEYIPGRFADLGYFGGVAFRLGYYYEQSYLEIKRKRIAENGFSAGMGFPMLQNKTTFNVAYNYGKSGTMDNGLIQERNHSFMVSLTLHDWWFIKRKID
jgi:long-subunit fatty acid transport protein